MNRYTFSKKMEDDFGSASSGPLQLPIRKASIFSPFPISSESSESVDKDTLIDEMQTKIGELLHVNQELCATKNEIEILKEELRIQEQKFNRQREDYELTIRNLEDKVRDQEDTIHTQEHQIQDLSEDNANLQEKISELKQKMAHASQSSEDEFKRQIQSQKGEFQATVAMKDREIKALKSQIKELKQQQDSSSDSMYQQRIENEKLQSVNGHQQSELKRQESEIVKLNEKLQKQKDTAKENKAASKKLATELLTLQNELKTSKDKEESLKQKLAKKDIELNTAREELHKVLSISPGFKDTEEMRTFIEKRKAEIESLTKRAKKGEATVKKCLKTIKGHEATIKEANHEAKEATTKITSMEEKLVTQTIQINKLTKTMDHQATRLKVIPVFERANIMLSKRLASINASVREDDDVMSIRTLITTSIMLLRWRSLPGVPKVFTQDSRNWWWMTAGQDNTVTGNEISEKIATLNTALASSKESEAKLQQALTECNDKLSIALRDCDNAKQQFGDENEKTVKLQKQIELLKEELEKRVEPEEHQLLVEKLAQTKDKYRQAKAAAKENTIEITNLQMTLAQTKQRLNHQVAITKQKERSLEDAKFELYQAQDGIAHLREGNTVKTREILSLERTLGKQRQVADCITSQNDILALENRRMAVQVRGYKRRLDGEKL